MSGRRRRSPCARALATTLVATALAVPGHAAGLELGPELAAEAPAIVPTRDAVGPMAMAASRDAVLVVFTVGTYAESRLRGVLLGGDGSPRAWRSFELPVADVGEAPAIASDGGGFLVAWTERPWDGSPAVVRAVRVDRNGWLVDAAPLELSPDASDQPPAVAFGAGEYRLVWNEWGRLVAARLAPDGGPPSPAEMIAVGSGPALGFEGARFVVAFVCGDSSETCIAWMDPSGSPPLRTARVTGSAFASSIEVAAAGGRSLVAWESSTRTVRAVLADFGSAAPLEGFQLASFARDPRVASDGQGFLVAWSSVRFSAGEDVLALHLDGDGGITSTQAIPVVSMPARELASALVPTTTGYLVGWREMRADGRALPHVIATNPIGESGGSAGVPVALAPASQTEPSLAFGVDRYLLAWTDERDPNLGVRGMLLSAGGIPLSPGRFDVAAGSGTQRRPSVAFDGERFVVAYETAPDPASDETDVVAVRVDLGGTVLDSSPLPVCREPGPQRLASVAAAGGEALAAWRDDRAGEGGAWVGRIAGDGTLPDGAGMPVAALRLPFAGPAVAAAPDAWVVGATYSSGSMCVARLDRALQPDAATLCVGDHSSGRPSLACSGPACAAGAPRFLAGFAADAAPLETAWVAALPDRVFPVGPQLADDGAHWVAGRSWRGDDEWERDPPWSYEVTWVARDGRLLGTFAVPPGDAFREAVPAVASAGDGGVLLAYPRPRPDDPSGATLLVRTARLREPRGAPCSAALGCESGFCADGVCCQFACGADDPTDCQACSVATGAQEDGRCSALPAGHVCRGSVGPCDAEEVCDGYLLACGADARVAAGTTCRPAYGPCDRIDTCDGGDVGCSDDVAPEATGCDDEDPCTTRDACRGGACVGDWQCTGSRPPAPPSPPDPVPPAAPPASEPAGQEPAGCGCVSSTPGDLAFALLTTCAALGGARRRRARPLR